MNEAPDKLAAVLQREYQAADSYRDTLAQLEDQAFRYYEAQPFGNEVEGRSQVVLPDVQETIDYMLPSIVRTFVSGDRTVEFEATDEADEKGAEEATAAVNYAFMRKQDGYRILQDACNDGLLRKIGIFKTGYETYEKVTRETVTLDPVQLGELPDEVEIEDMAENEDGSVTVSLKQTRQEKRFCDHAIPPANFRFSPRARHEDEADYICHADPEVTRSDLVEMGFDREQAYRLPGHNRETFGNTESSTLDQFIDEESTAALEKVLLCEEYARIDLDGDGVAERIKVFRVENEILIDAETGKPSIETVEDQPFAVFCPYPRPHRLVGYSLADKVMDIQLNRSFVARQLNDGLALSNMPRPIIDSRMADADT
ncbi:MAG: portal protein, partial [Beijerinckiaceae bacterium]